MGQKKLERFAELETFTNVLQFPRNMPGKWSGFFKNNKPLTLELACGKGEYAVGLGRLYPERNFIGIDLKGNRIWVGAKKALQENLGNVAFLRTQIDQLNDYFDRNEVSEIWITFPDPQLRLSKAKKRLTHPKFLRVYQQVLVPGGLIHLKTDSPDLYRFTKTVIQLYGCILHRDIDDVNRQENRGDELKIKTHYELMDIAGSNRIHYLCFSLPQIVAGKEKDEVLSHLLLAEKEKTGKPESGERSISHQTLPGELIEGADYYINEDGRMVFTEKYHLDKGYCCGNGCRHCPYHYENVPEPVRSGLLGKKENKR